MMNYRPEIDGLRALAVLPVILFHAGFSHFSGGYVGVDVFFVISGYLITTILLVDLERGRFSFATFYERRARRILPALFAMMAVCSFAAWVLLLPGEFKEYSQSVASVVIFGSNVHFWRKSGYFDSDAELKPLLHTWSLAVEEQFYLIFPVILYFGWRFQRRSLPTALLVIAALSLALAQWGALTRPATAFFLMPTRCWELAIGALLAFHFRRASNRLRSRTEGEVLGAVGLVLLGYSVIMFDSTTPFPSLYALVPTVGTALIILYAWPHTFVGRLLGSRIMVGVGLLSYSAYLWHQPLFAFTRYRIGELNGPFASLLIVSTFAIAYGSWRFIEQPFRRKGAYSRKQIFTYSLVATTVFFAAGMFGDATGGFPGRLDAERARFAAYFENSLPRWQYVERERIQEVFRKDCNWYDVEAYRRGEDTRVPRTSIPSDCYQRSPQVRRAVLIWGDSHAQQLRHGLNQWLPRDWQILQIASSACHARLQAKPNALDYCEYANWFALKVVEDARPEVVLIAQKDNHDINRMNMLSGELLSRGVRKVVFTGPAPHWRRGGLPNVIMQSLWTRIPRRTFTGLDKSYLELDRTVQAKFETTSARTYLSIIDYLCNVEGCLVYLGDDPMTGISTWDYGHLTPIASSAFARDIVVPTLIASEPSRSISRRAD